MGAETPHILLVEDEVTHAELIRRAFTDRGEQVHLTMAQSLREARASLVPIFPMWRSSICCCPTDKVLTCCRLTRMQHAILL